MRGRRNTGWSIIRRQHVEGVAVSEDEMAAFGPPEALAQAFEAAMLGADSAADRRFEHADAAAQLAVIGCQISEQDDLLELLGPGRRRVGARARNPGRGLGRVVVRQFHHAARSRRDD